MCTIPIYILNDKYLPAAYNIHMDKYPLHGYTILKREMEIGKAANPGALSFLR